MGEMPAWQSPTTPDFFGRHTRGFAKFSDALFACLLVARRCGKSSKTSFSLINQRAGERWVKFVVNDGSFDDSE